MKLFIALTVMVLATVGCASTPLSFHTLPAETPEADKVAAVANAAAFAEAANSAQSGASAKAVQVEAPGEDNAPPAPPVTAADAPPMYTYDPWERLNRFTYRFNARIDEAVLLPVANTYRRVPAPLRAGVHNFFGNLAEFDSVVNYGLQGRFKFSLRSFERLAINSTIGLGGIVDVATRLKLPGAPTGFSTTLSKWGMHPGPFLVIPLLGPSTLREGFGLFADYVTLYGIDPFFVDPVKLYRGTASWVTTPVKGVDQRANVNFRYYSTGSPFEYETIRFLYVRKTLIEDEGLHAKDPNKRSVADVPAGK
jgi:phospholipid-binding lipoprotein MlaA